MRLMTRNFDRTYTISGVATTFDWQYQYELTSKYAKTAYTQVTAMVFDETNKKLYAAVIIRADVPDTH